jgi:hypothetical protein
MFVGSVGMLRPSARSTFKCRVMKAAVPATISVVPRFFMAANASDLACYIQSYQSLRSVANELRTSSSHHRLVALHSVRATPWRNTTPMRRPMRHMTLHE